MTLYKWSQTAAANGNADSTCPFPEGMSPAAVNDGTRGMMAAVAKYRDDIAGAIVTSGAVNAYSAFCFLGFDSLVFMDGQIIAFSPHITNTGACQFNVDGFGLKGLRPSPGVDFLGGELVQGTPYMARFSNADGSWYVHGFFISPFNVPFLSGMDYWDTVAPSSAFIFPIGQAISRTAFPRAFARWGTTFGPGDGANTFNVPDKRGRASAALDNMGGVDSGRLAAGALAGARLSLGGAGGEPIHTLNAGEIPMITSVENGLAVTVFVNGGGNLAHTASTISAFGAGGGNAAAPVSNSGAWDAVDRLSGNININTSSNNTGGQAHNNMQPTILCNYIIRIL